jgi:O-antigen ligase
VLQLNGAANQKDLSNQIGSPPISPASGLGGTQRALYLAVVVLLPLALGGGPLWAWSLAEVLIGLSAILLSIRRAIGSTPYIPLEGVRAAALLMFLSFAWAVTQLLPTPFAHPVWAETAAALGNPVRGSIALDRSAGLRSLSRLLMYVVAFFVTYQVFYRSSQATSALKALAVATTCYSIYGLCAYVFTPDHLLWLRRWAYFDDLTSTFVNRNSFATYAGLGLLMNYTWLRSMSNDRSSSRRPLRLRIVAFLNLVTRRAPLPLIGLASTSAALLLTHSRGGLIAATLGLGAILVLELLGRWRMSGQQRLLIGVASLGFLLTLALSGETTLARLLGTNPYAEERLQIYAMVRDAIAASPYLGHGLGSFETVFPIYAGTPAALRYDLAHNDYLELAFELGIPAATSLVLALLLIAFKCLRDALAGRRNSSLPTLGVGASILVGVHALVDFSLQMPAVALTYATVLGLAVGQSRARDLSSRSQMQQGPEQSTARATIALHRASGWMETAIESTARKGGQHGRGHEAANPRKGDDVLADPQGNMVVHER